MARTFLFLIPLLALGGWWLAAHGEGSRLGLSPANLEARDPGANSVQPVALAGEGSVPNTVPGSAFEAPLSARQPSVERQPDVARPEPPKITLSGTFTGYTPERKNEVATLVVSRIHELQQSENIFWGGAINLRLVDSNSSHATYELVNAARGSTEAVSTEVRLGERWTVENLSPGEYRVVANTMGGEPLFGALSALTLVPGQPADRYRLALEKVPSLSGLIRTEWGAPIEGASITVHGTQPGWLRATNAARYMQRDPFPAISSIHKNPLDAPLTTSAAGTFAERYFLAGDVRVDIQADGFLPHTETLQLTPGENRFQPITLIKQQIVAGQVFWPDGLPAQGVSIFARTEHQGENTDTDEQGRFRLGLRPAHLLLYARGGGSSGQDFSSRQEFPAGPHLEHLVITLDPSPVISGRVVDTSGAALAGWSVEARDVSNHRVTRKGNTGADGSFRVVGLYAGTYDLRVDGWATPLTRVRVYPGAPGPDIVLEVPAQAILARSKIAAERAQRIQQLQRNVLEIQNADAVLSLPRIDTGGLNGGWVEDQTLQIYSELILEDLEIQVELAEELRTNTDQVQQQLELQDRQQVIDDR